MAIKFLYDDQVIAAGTVISANSTVDAVANVANRWPTKQWVSSSGIYSAHIVVMLSLTAPIAGVALVEHDLAGASAGASASVYHSLTGSVWTKIGEIPFVTGNTVLPYFFSSVSAKYWKVSFRDAPSLGDFRLGRLMLGTAWTPTTGDAEEVNVEFVDPSELKESDGGQVHVNQREVHDEIDVKIPFLYKTELDEFRAVTQALKQEPIVIEILNENSGTYDNLAYYGSVKAGQAERRASSWLNLSVKIREWI